MSHIDRLIAELCPEGVHVQELATIGTITRGKRFVKADMLEAGVPCIHYGEIYTKYGSAATEAFSYLDPLQATRLRSAQPGDVIIASAGETIEDIGKAVAWLGTENVVIHDACYAFRSPLEPKFAAYFFQTDNFRSQIRRNISSSKISSISTRSLGRVRIPVPPIEVQQEIVRVLDRFAHLERELGVQLEAELEARRQQYEHYRNDMLTLAEGGLHVPLGDLCSSITTGKLDVNAKVEGGKYPFFTCDAKPYAIDTWAFDTEAILLSGNGSRVGHVSYYHGKFNAYQRTYIVSDFSLQISVPYLLHYLSAFFRDYVSIISRKGSVPYITLPMLKAFSVPLPSIDQQNRIVQILDSFDALVNNVSVSLPAELAARRKQYEHYRDRLLTFDEAVA